MRGFFPLCHAISLLQALWHSRLYMTTAIAGGFLRLNKIELLASVLKVVEDSGLSDVQSVYNGFKEWDTDKVKTGFSTKAEKFSESDVNGCLKFARDKGWVK
jgi:hypothetical protein